MNHLSVFAEYRAYLFTIAQRILGSAGDVEDLLQETFLRWQQTPLAQIRSPKAFLSTVLKRLCLNHLDSAYVRYSGGSLDDSSVVPQTESSDSTLSFGERLTPALQVIFERLAPKERLVFVLREVFDYDYEEIAPLIEKNVANCRQLLRRAHQHLIEGKRRFNVTSEQLHRLTNEFATTFRTGDLNSLLSALT
jgi:RNA polymerase sigma-70 factor (ECF subfamily)